MSKKKGKKSSDKTVLQVLVLIAASLDILDKLIEIIKHLIE